MVDSPGSTEQFKPFTTYSSVNKTVVSIVIGGLIMLGMFFFVAAFRRGIGRMGTDEWFLGTCGLGFLFFSVYLVRFVLSPRVVIEKEFFLISDFYRKRKFAYEEIRALAEFVRMMPIRFNQNRCLRISVLAIRLRSGKLIQIALPNSQDNQDCLNALSNASGLSIESLGVDPPNVNQWLLEAQ